ncbi:DUF3558 family protein [Saccharopolyspora sp. CA-218241]|uniref:DUF3558 family protein n=1 Tax=Saccharopolyspora sp. CA-218241 TaxID=3240027 RepID=UPI003D9850E1
MTAARRWLPALSASLLVALAGCGASITGEPVPAVGFRDDSASIAAIPTPRAVTGVDPCTLLAPADLDQAGGTTGGPYPGNPTPRTCTYALGGAQPGNTAAVGFNDEFEAAKAKQPRGVDVDVEGHSAWLYCDVIDGFQTCTATAAINAEHTLVTMLSLRGATAADTTDVLQDLTTAALRNLPTG